MKVKKIVLEIGCLILFIVMLILIVVLSQFGRSDMIAYDLIPNNKKAAIQNTNYLQELVDNIYERGGGTIKIPQGKFYFSVDENDGNHQDLESDESGPKNGSHFVIECRSNVKIEGSGIDKTILKPLGDYPHGIDMFWYVDFRKFNYLKYVDFKDFTIDGSLTSASDKQFNARGKGFNIYPVSDCNWESVKVINTDGTGFGMDLPINCTVKNCFAIGCGKAASVNDVGASGFGIGIGYSQKESIYIKNCTAIGNRKFGFFFEHQGRFNDNINARKAKGKNKDSKFDGYVVDNCIARGNLYNFGGEKANDVIYYKCNSQYASKKDPDPLKSKNKAAIYLGMNSYRIAFIDCAIEQRYYDIYSDAINWAIKYNIVDVGDYSIFLKPSEKIKKSEALSLLWRFHNRNGNILLLDDEIDTGYSDIENGSWRDLSSESLKYIDAIMWAQKCKILDDNSSEFGIDDNCKYFDLIKWLWKLDGSPTDNVVSKKYDQYENYNDALNWAYSLVLINDQVKEDDVMSRLEAIEIIYRHIRFTNLINSLSQ